MQGPDNEDVTVLVDCPLTVVEVNRTPGWQHIRVVDKDTGTVLEDVTKVDLEACLVWRWVKERSHPFSGNYRLMCPPEVLEEFKEEWRRWR